MSRQLAIALAVVAVCALIANAGQATRSGLVSDAGTGAAVAGATLRVTAPGEATTKPALASTVTRDDGAFELPADGVRGVLEVTAPGYATARLLWPPRNEQSLMQIALERGATLPVRVSDYRGAPLSAVLAVTTFHPGNVVSSGVRVLNGVAEAGGLPSGPAMIIALAEGMAPAATTVRIEAGTRHSPLNMTLLEAGIVSGIVLDGNGDRRPEAEVVAAYGRELALNVALGNYLSRRKPTGGELDFEIRNVIPGAPVQVFARHGDKRSAASTVAVGAGERRSDVVLVLK